MGVINPLLPEEGRRLFPLAWAHERRSQRLRSGAAPATITFEEENAFHAAGATEKHVDRETAPSICCGLRLEGYCRRRCHSRITHYA